MGAARARPAPMVDAALGGRRHAVDPEAMESAFEHAFVMFDDAWRENRQVTAVEAAHLVIDHLGVDLAPDAHAAVVDAFVHGAAGLDVELADKRVEETLVGLEQGGASRHHLRRRADAVGGAARLHASHGVLDLFDHWSFSERGRLLTGCRDLRAHAGRPRRRGARSAAHVGDLRRTDIAGAPGHGDGGCALPRHRRRPGPRRLSPKATT